MMISFFNKNIAIFYRNFHAAVAVLAIGGILIWALIETKDIGADKITSKEIVIANVLTVNNNNGMHFGKIEIENGDKKEIRFYQPIPAVGETMPIEIWHYENGTKSYNINQQQWILYRLKL
ncbi:MAG: hypothetical protein OEY00_11005 [Gammaproteobacteria bacterium]|nr:hypothetical protein [Gammaproteobacteria bacterium]